MMCQFCGKHEANNKFLVNFMGQESEVFICDECLKNFGHYAGMPGNSGVTVPESGQALNKMPSWLMGFRAPGENRPEELFGQDAGIELRMKRKLNQLHRQLKHAVDEEKYEDAAVLRDKINTIKNEVFINGK